MLQNESMFLFSFQKNTSWDLCPNIIICGWNDGGNFSKTGDHTVSKECPCDSLITVVSPCNTLSENKKINYMYSLSKIFLSENKKVLYCMKFKQLTLGVWY